MRSVYEELISPLTEFSETKSSQIDSKSGSTSLLFSDFLFKLILAYVMRFPSLRVLVTKLTTNSTVKELGFDPSPFSTLKDGFSRFDACYFQQAFEALLKTGHWFSIPSIDN